MGRKKIIKQEPVWYRVETDDQLHRDCMVKRARSRKLKTKTGILPNDMFFANIYSPPDKYPFIEEEAIKLKQDILLGLVPEINKPKYVKLELEIEIERLNEEISVIKDNFIEARKAFNKDKENFYVLNKASKELYLFLRDCISRGHTIYIQSKDGRECFVRAIGERFNITEFKCCGKKHPIPLDWTSTNIINLERLEIV